jgi:hypothetical protein
LLNVKQRDPLHILDYVDNIYKDNKVIDQEFFAKTSDYKYPDLPPYLRKGDPRTDSDADTLLIQKFNENETSHSLLKDGQFFMSIKDLIRNHSSSSTENLNATKVLRFVFSAEKTRKLLAKCKSDGLKLTGVLNMFVILAYKSMSNKYGHELKKAYYMNSISLRQFLPEEMRPYSNTFSYMANAMPISFSLENYENNDSIEYYLNNFWKLAKLESNTLHKKIANNQQYIRWDWTKVNRGEDQMRFYYYLSNIGSYRWPLVVSTTSPFELKGSFMSMNLKKTENAKFEFELNTVSINDTLFWSCLYHFSSNDFDKMDELIQSVIYVSEKVVQSL